MREMRDSGVEWMGKVPENWNIVALKFLCSMLERHYLLNKFRKKENIRFMVAMDCEGIIRRPILSVTTYLSVGKAHYAEMFIMYKVSSGQQNTQ